MFTDPQTLTIDSDDKICPRISSSESKSIYQTVDMTYKLTLSHQISKSRTRRMARVDHRAIVADPLTAVNDYENLGVYIVIDEPEYGFSDAVITNVVNGLIAWLSTANIAKLLGHEH